MRPRPRKPNNGSKYLSTAARNNELNRENRLLTESNELLIMYNSLLKKYIKLKQENNNLKHKLEMEPFENLSISELGLSHLLCNYLKMKCDIYTIGDLIQYSEDELYDLLDKYRFNDNPMEKINILLLEKGLFLNDENDELQSRIIKLRKKVKYLEGENERFERKIKSEKENDKNIIEDLNFSSRILRVFVQNHIKYVSDLSKLSKLELISIFSKYNFDDDEIKLILEILESMLAELGLEFKNPEEEKLQQVIDYIRTLDLYYLGNNNDFNGENLVPFDLAEVVLTQLGIDLEMPPQNVKKYN